ncbi:GH36-type glycosyl hydrolase domain-containing protein [Methylococcus sp. EFPC2]|uniref:GH36-type glycosyl hydrolase domain-containing protein n=1 Tax=Methylococcus sp. EFPC2 TaxID=2812648 RepID=UPI00196888BF|nr:glucoamylase family protein [Methylococcus sp. EFPC2]QSA97767.1 phosphorylase [Methylococcus sp. EFPC2]
MTKRREHRRHARVDHPGGEEAPIRFELFNTERLEEHAVSLAKAQKVSRLKKGRKLIPRVRENCRVLLDAYNAVAQAVREQHAITPAAEWLLDNFHVIEEQVGDILVDLPESYYRELPKLSVGVLEGYPRVYGIAWALVAHTDSRFAPELLTLFVRAYQTVDPLTLGELWAIPSTLRVLLVENLRRLAVRIMRSQTGRRLADEFVDQVEQVAAQLDTPGLAIPVPEIPAAPLRQAYAVQILQRLHDPHPAAAISLDFLTDWLNEQGVGLDEIVHQEHADQIADNWTVRNIIISMRAISAFEWPQFVEDVSLVDECLRAHDGYAAMDFLTRDRYRHAVEDLAKRSLYSEVEIARRVMTKVRQACELCTADGRQEEPGYYLIGAGRYAFERDVDFQPTMKQRLLRAYVSRAGLAYVGTLSLLTLLLLALPLNAALAAGLSGVPLFLLTLFGLFPASDIVVGLANRLIIAGLPPFHLPRLDLKGGVPQTLSTFVVVPTMFVSEAGIKELVEQMEIRYLSNPGGEVRFALLSDWADADQETLPNDDRLLSLAASAVAALNAKYGEQRFFLFHRKRLWNPSEGKWMGWERKRGKLHEFNRLLRGAEDTSFLPIGGQPAAAPPGVCYVITLDTDTKLPMGVVSHLVGVAAHPLNQPVFDSVSQCVVDGYGILQPRVTPTLPQRRERSLFHQIFAGASGIDAYAGEVSELYQDLFGLGTYSGKGLYHVDSFEAALAGRVPENTQLSHDLFESLFARCALVSDIEFFEEFPSHSEVAASREHRWVRGDWQLLPWIFGPLGKGMPMIGRWKMLDNLRRSLSAPGAFFALVAAWAIPNAPQAILTGFVLTALAFPAILAAMSGFTSSRRGISLLTHLRAAGENVLWGVGNSLVALALLAQHAWLMLDAIARTLVRMFITRRQLLMWVTAHQAKTAASHALRSLVRPLGSSSTIVIVTGAVVLIFNPAGLPLAAPFLLLWWLAPVVARALSLPPRLDRAESLLPEDTVRLRLIGRRIWRFFTTFVTAEEHYLPPDNFQEDPQPVVAHRSSPTNFGLYLLSVVAARDFGWLGLVDTVERLEATLTTLVGLPRLHGHFYNWYDTRDLHMLEPRYVSTVDSGNLAGHLLALAQACREMRERPLDLANALAGLADTHSLLAAALDTINDDRRTLTVTLSEMRVKVAVLGKLLASHPADPDGWGHLWRELTRCADTLLDLARAYTSERGEADSEVLAWASLLCDDIRSHARDVECLLPWIHFAGRLDAYLAPKTQCPHLAAFRKQLTLTTCLGDLSNCYELGLTHLEASPEGPLAPGDLEALAALLRRAGEQAAELTRRLENMVAQMDSLFHEMDFRFLYDTDRHMFALGYRVAEGTLDPSYYDLLASEARLSSFIAIAKREVPSTHWFHLGRRVTRAAHGTVLLSWSGSMFEYLMPSLVNFTPRYSLLDQTCRLVVKRQIQYGKERGVPWGVSESAFNGRDLYLTYQYSAFGVPGLGMKRGLGDDLVIAPYATALAAMYFPHAAMENFERLERQGAAGRYGYYEALDFTPTRLAEGQRVAVVRCYMAHHQGMSLVALANVLHDGAMRHRFHRAPFIQAADLLLQERIPHGAETSSLPMLEALAETKQSVQPPVRRVPSPTSTVPSAHLLSNGRYAVMITAAGSGYSLSQNLAVTRWREDVTRDASGSFIYLRDVENGEVWSAGYQPTVAAPDHYEVVFVEDRARIIRSDGNLVSALEIVVSPEDDAEIRRLSLTNTGSRAREIEVTSYAEVVLAAMPADIAHPAFSNLFVHTEYLPQTRALIAVRRRRAASDPKIWAAHVLAGRQTGDGLQYETDRARFVGRGQTLRGPIAVMDGRPLSNTVGAVLDPIFSLRTRVQIEAGATEHLTFTTLVATSRQGVEDLADKYHHVAAFDRVSSLAWTHAHVQLRHLRTRPDEAQLFQDLANRLLYTDPSLRPTGKVLQMNTLNVTGLWRHGISGDRPIVLLRVAEPEDRTIIEQLLRAHEYWRIKGLAADLVILNDKEVSYVEDLQTLLEGMVRESQVLSAHHVHAEHGAIFLMRVDQLSAEEQLLLQTVARAVLVSNRGTLAEQLLRHPRPAAAFVAAPVLPKGKADTPALTLPPLEFFNGLGGFAEDGREYVIVLDKGQWTPAPWINVIANPDFGFMVSASGSGCTWCGNSRENQLTPWSNDPVSDPSGEVFYLRDDETSELWTPTALPIRVDQASYLIRHGQGYSRFEHASHGIHSELLQFVSPDDPVKISSLTLTNVSGRSRRLTVAAYVEWVLGASRSVTAPHIVTEVDPETRALFAYNPWSLEFGQRVAFADLVGQQTSWTGNRAEFIGRNGSLDAPAGLLNPKALKNRVGAGLDPCTALETVIELEPDGRAEIVFLLGQGKDRAQASELVRRYRATEVATTFAQVTQSWDQVLGKVQVKTPDRELDLLLNRWLLYQTLSCRIWARAAFYQVGGAFGFRDQLQDGMALAVARPDLTRAHLLRAAARQFGEGDVQHWWHPPTGRGVRTRFSDDRIWLPYAVAQYLKVSGDADVLNELVPFLQGPELLPEQDDAYYEPTLSNEKASLYEHCARALDLSLETGAHGLPLMGSGDWNDGMNRVGNQGKGESVWLAWFLIATLSEFASIAEARGDNERALRWRKHDIKLKTAVEAEGWDGAWYRRAYFDDGSPLGSAGNAECRIDSIAQSWGVISSAADIERAQRAMNSVREYLVRYGDDLVLLFTPPFEKTERDPGYIKSYPPGVRENGGQYTHAAIWSVIAYAMQGEGDQAADLLRMLNPIKRTATRTGVYAYKVEPYVLAADIYAEPPHVRRGGWTWYTGAAGWYYRAGLEWILGLQVRADRLVFNPCIPRNWHSYSIIYRHDNTLYEITIENPNGVAHGVATIELDGERQSVGSGIALRDDGQAHKVRVVLG